ncbi:signal peptidase complex subunit [Klebsormidium nitens]|uniref:Signal peptidase complex subunit 3 n=1 Tax=Klebsormidium nitens TaxID=105231 RepID=A0A1Y1IFX4_KLENI|nr:signal peptidase complex subunit [Klebsormidium nitens]|eukprot:GAQ87666.1 signal peptidase complex subunit [Klebsormidium nitens]
MHTFLYRTNSLLTFVASVLVVLCILASITDYFHRDSAVVAVDIVQVDRFQVSQAGNDEAFLAFNISADLRSVFTWNTKQLFVFLAVEYATPENAVNQVSVWDRIIERREDALIALPRVQNKYRLVDQGRNMRGRDLNLTMYWNAMPKSGRIYTGQKTLTGYRLPDTYS